MVNNQAYKSFKIFHPPLFSEPVVDPVAPPKKKKLILIKKRKVEKPVPEKLEKSIPAVNTKSPKKTPPV